MMTTDIMATDSDTRPATADDVAATPEPDPVIDEVSGRDADDDRRRSRAGEWRTPASMLLYVAAVTCFAVAVNRTDEADIDGLGIFRALPMWYWIATTLAVIGFVWSLPAPRSRRSVVSREGGRSPSGETAMSWVLLTSLIVFLHGLPGFVEQNPRFGIAWVHAGFSEHIAANGELLTNVDARFSWPGFFTASAWLQRIAGTDDILWLVRFAPIVINVVIVCIVVSLARALGANDRQSLVAAAIFVVADWIGQDYFAPQAIGFIFTMTIVTALLRFFPGRPTGRRWINRLAGSASPPAEGLSGRPAVLAYLAIVFVVGALVVTHQISPALLLAMVFALTLVGRIRTPAVVWVIGLAYLGYVSFGAEAYWLGHLETVTGSVGDVGGVVNENVNRRAASGSSDREVLVRIRILSMLGLWVTTAGILLLRKVRGRLDPALPALFLPPFLAVALQPYGGEVLLRVAFFVLPAAAVTLATTDWSRLAQTRGSRVVGRIVGVALLTAAVPVLILARFGNESYEAVTDEAIAINEVMLDETPPGAVVFRGNAFSLYYVDRIDEIRYRTLSDDIDEAIDDLDNAAARRPTFVLFTGTQQRYASEVRGSEPTFYSDYADDLIDRGGFRTVARDGSDILLEYVGSET